MKKSIVLFFSFWTLLSALQSFHMELVDDEAYYWVCGNVLEWGSYHTPPLVPFLSKIGYIILPNEFGVRLFYLLAHIFTLIIIERLTKPTDAKLFIIILASFLAMHVAGFWAVPDIPYLFFTVILIHFFTKFAEKESIMNGLAIAICSALIMYSKYHGAIIILALIIANAQLLKRPAIYGIGLLALLLYTPHILWLYNHDWVTLNFHLYNRERSGYHWYYPLHYLAGLILITGPIIGLILMPIVLKFEPENRLHHNLKYVFYSILIFFLLLSFRNRIEANWMVAAIIPTAILGYHAASQRPKLRKWIMWSFPISIIMAIILRIFLTVDLLPEYKLFTKVKEFHKSKEWARQLELVAANAPIIFQGGLQQPSKYLFYSQQKKATNLTPITSSPSQFLLLNNQHKFHGKEIMLLQNYAGPAFTPLQTNKGIIYYKFIDSFWSYYDVKINATIKNKHYKASSTINVPIEIVDFEKLNLNPQAAQNSFISYFIIENNNYLISELTTITLVDLKQSNGKMILPVKLPNKTGTFIFRVAIWTKDLNPGYNSNPITIEIK